MSIETHDLKNRLAVALGYAQLLSRTDLTAKQRTWVDYILSACGEEGELLLSTLARSLGVSPQVARDGTLETSQLEYLEPALKQALTLLTDRRSGPNSVTLSFANEGHCSFCGEPVHTGGLQLSSRNSLPAMSNALESFPFDCEHFHVVARAAHDGSFVAIFPAGDHT